jgi:oligopeptidase B
MPNVPVAPKRPYAITQHDATRNDDYFWMRHREDPAVMAYLKTESDYLEEVMQHTQALQAQLFDELKARIQEDDSSVPEQHGDFFYYQRLERGKQYPIFCRKPRSSGAPEEILLDQNALAEGKSFCRIGAFSVSPDDRMLAYSIDPDGSERCDLFIKDLTGGKLFPEKIANTLGDVYDHSGLAWANDGATLFYTTLDHANRPHKLYRHTIGTDPAQDVLLHHEADESFFLSIHKSRSDAYVLMLLRSTTTRECHYLDAGRPQGDLRVIAPRAHGVEYFVEHHGDQFYIITNEQAQNFKLLSAPVADPSPKNWREILPHRADVLLEGIEPFENHLVLHERKDGFKQIRISAPDGVSNVRYVPFPEPVYSVLTAANPEFKTSVVRFTYSSLITPNSVIDYHMDSGEWELKKRDEIPSGYDPSQYVTERLFAVSHDGTRVPLSIVHKKGLPRDGKNPTLLYSYGSYGASVDAAFNANRFSLIDRGFVFAIGHIRGGSELGRAWYDHGRMLHKKNTFLDFIACAEHLIKEGYTSKDKLAIQGVSAGGLLVGASMIMRPDLFKAVIAKVPFVDVINSMSDAAIPLTVIEWEQWGNPAIREQYDYMLSYSPYDNIRATAYPHLLLTTGLNDPRVAYWEPAKFAAKLRALKTDQNLLLLKTNFDAGHAGASGRYDFLKEITFEYAFLIDRLGV